MPARPTRRPLLALFCLLLAAIALPAAAQQPPNGYQDLVRAGELLQKSRRFQAAQAANATLLQKREALADGPVRDALVLLNRALGKPVYAPAPTTASKLPLDDFKHFRNLGRLLRLQQYVLLADGRVREAVLTGRLCLRLGQMVHTDSVLSGLVGVAVSALGIRELGAHLDQLSVRDCELLHEVCLEWLNAPDPLLKVLEGERQMIRRTLAEQKQELLREAGADAGPDAGQLFDRAAPLVDAVFVRLFEETRKPFWERKPVALPAEARGTPAGALIELLLPTVNRLGDVYAREQAGVRLLACHAAVLRYRWEQDRVPASLAQLDLRELAVDPFTGQVLKYQPLGAGRYRLTSAGPVVTDDPDAVNGRKPVSVVPD